MGTSQMNGFCSFTLSRCLELLLMPPVEGGRLWVGEDDGVQKHWDPSKSSTQGVPRWGGEWASATGSRLTTPGGCWGKLGLKACWAVASGKRQVVMNYSGELWMLLSRYVSAKEHMIVPASILTSLIFKASNCQYSLFYNYALLC